MEHFTQLKDQNEKLREANTSGKQIVRKLANAHRLSQGMLRKHSDEVWP